MHFVTSSFTHVVDMIPLNKMFVTAVSALVSKLLSHSSLNINSRVGNFRCFTGFYPVDRVEAELYSGSSEPLLE